MAYDPVKMHFTSQIAFRETFDQEPIGDKWQGFIEGRLLLQAEHDRKTGKELGERESNLANDLAWAISVVERLKYDRSRLLSTIARVCTWSCGDDMAQALQAELDLFNALTR